MAPGPDGGLYVSIPTRAGGVLALLDEAGNPRSGWPIVLPAVESCGSMYAAADGSVRLLCGLPPVGEAMDSTSERVFGFDSTGRQMSGWPVDAELAVAGRMIGDSLWLVIEPAAAEEEAPPNPMYMIKILADGSSTQGTSTGLNAGDGVAIGPDGIGYTTRHYDWSPSDLADVTSDVTAFDLAGRRAGWPVTIKGNASAVAFDSSGHVYLVVGSPSSPPARTVVLDTDGQLLSAGSKELSITSSTTWDGAGGEIAGPPIVAGDGRAFVVDTQGRDTRILAVTPGGLPTADWPYASSTGMGWTGFCGDGDTGCGHVRTMPVVGSNGDLYVIHAPTSRSTGGSIVAIEPNARVRPGWPVGLKRAGSMFWATEADPSGGAWVLAIEPETNGASATILSLAEDSTVRWSTTIVVP